MNEKKIRALFDNDTITVYQAYNSDIANNAVKLQTFVSPPFKKERMTWIKPSFLWMMYRSGWGTKESQEHILAIKIKKKGFDWALQKACLSNFDNFVHCSPENWKQKLHNSPVRVQWDPERDIFSHPLPYRSVQVGLSGVAVEKYISNWIVQIDDISEYCKNIHQLIKGSQIDKAIHLLPIEQLYPLPPNISIF